MDRHATRIQLLISENPNKLIQITDKYGKNNSDFDN